MVAEKINLKSEENIRRLADFLEKQGLTFEGVPEYAVALYDGNEIIGSASYDDGLIKYFAVKEEYRGLDIAGKLLTQLRQYAFEKGEEKLSLVTTPENEKLFGGLLFNEVERTENTVFMESPFGCVEKYFDKIKDSRARGKVGSIVMNCDPFTKGHRYLIERAAKECDFVYVFILSEEKSFFSAEKRFAAVTEGVADLTNVKVVPTEKYLISSATFPTYFIKNRVETDGIFCELDIKMFTEKFIPRLCITKRYLGSEPFSSILSDYNRALAEALPKAGCEVEIINRLELEGNPVSAGTVRRLIMAGKTEEAKRLLPETTVNIIF